MPVRLQFKLTWLGNSSARHHDKMNGKASVLILKRAKLAGIKSRINSYMWTCFVLISIWNSAKHVDHVSSETGIVKQSGGLDYDDGIKTCVFSVYSEVEVDCSGQGAGRCHRALTIMPMKKFPQRIGGKAIVTANKHVYTLWPHMKYWMHIVFFPLLAALLGCY